MKDQVQRSIWSFCRFVKHIFLIDNQCKSTDNPPSAIQCTQSRATKEKMMTDENRFRLTQTVHGAG